MVRRGVQVSRGELLGGRDPRAETGPRLNLWGSWVPWSWVQVSSWETGIKCTDFSEGVTWWAGVLHLEPGGDGWVEAGAQEGIQGGRLGLHQGSRMEGQVDLTGSDGKHLLCGCSMSRWGCLGDRGDCRAVTPSWGRPGHPSGPGTPPRCALIAAALDSLSSCLWFICEGNSSSVGGIISVGSRVRCDGQRRTMNVQSRRNRAERWPARASLAKKQTRKCFWRSKK